MRNDNYAWLFRQVPPEQHNRLMIVTCGGTEIAIQTLLRIEVEFLAFKGRLAGSQDAGRVFFLPYANIDYFGFANALKESEFDAIFGVGGLAVGDAVAAAEAPVANARDGEATAADPANANRTPLPLKSEVLERFRARLGGTVPTISGMRPTVDG